MILSVSILATLASLFPLLVNGQTVNFASRSSSHGPLAKRAQIARVSPNYNHDFEFPLPVMPVKQPSTSAPLLPIRRANSHTVYIH